MVETTFWPKLCLIQMAGPDLACIVDVLAEDLDLTPFFRLMADESIMKVFHAGRQDIEIVHHLGKLIPHPVFDTQIAAMVCGYGDSISYDQLVNKITGIRIDKSLRFTDWSKRPLTDRQLAYAQADVTHLRDVYHSLQASLLEQNRADWVREEMEVLTSPQTYMTDPKDAWRRLKLRVRKPVELAIMQNLAEWREYEAQDRNVPRNRVLKDDAIYEISAQRPNSVGALANLRSIPRGFERSRSAKKLLSIVNEALSIPKSELPVFPKQRQQPEGSAAVVDLLKVFLKMISEKHGVAAKVIATVDDLEKIAANDDADVQALKGWRRELFGEPALRIKRGEIALAIRRKKVAIVEPLRKKRHEENGSATEPRGKEVAEFRSESGS